MVAGSGTGAGTWENGRIATSGMPFELSVTSRPPLKPVLPESVSVQIPERVL